MTYRRPTFAAAALLVAQLFGSGVVGLVHARESLDAPRHIEAAGDKQCLVVHDATRCVSCAAAHTRAITPATGVFLSALPPIGRVAPPVLAEPRAIAATPSADARAPPTPQG